MKIRSVLAIMAALVLCVFSAGTALAQNGVTDTEIHIGQWGPQTGPAAPWGAVARGTGVLFDMVNAQGGIHGRKIVYHMFDDGYNPAKTMAGVKELQESSTGIFAWASGVGTAPGLAVKEYLASRQVPWVGPASGSPHWSEPPQRNLFGVYPLYFLEAKTLTRYAVERMGKKRVAIMYQNDDYGKNGVDGAREELASHGLELVEAVPVELTDTDLRSHLLRLRRANADCVLLWLSPTHAVMSVGTAKAMNFTPQFMSTSTCSDFPLMIHISKGLWEGVITASFGELPTSGSPLMLEYRKAFDQFAAREERWGVFFTAGMGFVEPMVQALRNAGRDLTRERFIEEMEKIQNFQGILGNISFKPFDANDPSSRQGQYEVFLIECLANGDARRLTGWIDAR